MSVELFDKYQRTCALLERLYQRNNSRSRIEKTEAGVVDSFLALPEHIQKILFPNLELLEYFANYKHGWAA